jgi:hypothetical protein
MACDSQRQAVLDEMFDIPAIEDLAEQLEEAKEAENQAEQERLRDAIGRALNAVGRRFGGGPLGWGLRAAFETGFALGDLVAAPLQHMWDEVGNSRTRDAMINLWDPSAMPDRPAGGFFYRADLMVAFKVDGPGRYRFGVEFLNHRGNPQQVLTGEGTGLVFSHQTVMLPTIRSGARIRTFEILDDQCAAGEQLIVDPSPLNLCFTREIVADSPIDANGRIFFVAYCDTTTRCETPGSGGATSGGGTTTGGSGTSVEDPLAQLEAFTQLIGRLREQVAELESSENPEDRERARRLREWINDIWDRVWGP